MTVKLSQQDFRGLTRVIQSLPEFGIERDRRRLVAGALEGAENADVLLSHLDLSGMPAVASIDVIRSLSSFGKVAYGKEALGVFLNYIQPFAGDEGGALISRLFASYPLDAQASHDNDLGRWRGTDRPEDVQERIIGEDTLRHIRVLELALEAARAVVRLRVSEPNSPPWVGTGFMVAPDLLMTNHHVIQTPAQAVTTEYSFNYQLGHDGKELDVVPGRASEGGIFHTNLTLDYTVVQLAGVPGDTFGHLRITPVTARKDDRVAIIQHPGGHLKKISLQNNFVAYSDNQVLQYTTATLPGSSGSPVFNDDFEVVAIHHSGGSIPQPDTGKYYLRNAGTSMMAVLDDLKQHAPEIHAQLRK